MLYHQKNIIAYKWRYNLFSNPTVNIICNVYGDLNVIKNKFSYFTICFFLIVIVRTVDHQYEGILILRTYFSAKYYRKLITTFKTF